MSHDVPTIVIPHRNRQSHLRCVLARFAEFPVIVVEQADDKPFNRGALLNIGYVRARACGASRVVLHDCDLVPDDTLLAMYQEPWPKPVVHFGARFRRYNNSARYFGGVHGFVGGSFPGYPNHFWGWGGEDDALRKRVRLGDVTYARHGEYLDLEGLRHAKDKLRTLRKEEKCMNRWELLHADDASNDNHRTSTLRFHASWRTDEHGTQTGHITFIT